MTWTLQLHKKWELEQAYKKLFDEAQRYAPAPMDVMVYESTAEMMALGLSTASPCPEFSVTSELEAGRFHHTHLKICKKALSVFFFLVICVLLGRLPSTCCLIVNRKWEEISNKGILICYQSPIELVFPLEDFNLCSALWTTQNF